MNDENGEWFNLIMKKMVLFALSTSHKMLSEVLQSHGERMLYERRDALKAILVSMGELSDKVNSD